MARPLIIRPGAERRAFKEMADGGHLYIYTGEVGMFCPPPWPVEGSGALVYDGPPRRVGVRIVTRLLNAGAVWCPRFKANVFPDDVKRRVRTALAGRDVLWVSTPFTDTTGAKHG